MTAALADSAPRSALDAKSAKDAERTEDAKRTGGKKRVRIKHVTLDLFRNYVRLDAPFEARNIVITGENGAGKTNLLEALSYLAPGRGLRRATYAQVALNRPPGDGSWSVHCRLEGGEGEVSIGTGLTRALPDEPPESQRKVRIGGLKARNNDCLLDHARIVWVTPAMDGLFTGPTGDRRRFLDRLVLAIDPEHGRRVRDFEKCMRARNKLLEDPSCDPLWLDALEAQMAETASAVLFARAELMDLMRARRGREKGGAGDAELFPEAEMKVEGWLEDCDMSAADLEDGYRLSLARNRAGDRAAGRAMEGPHRSDFAVRHRAKRMEARLCSTGEQKALLLGIVLAHIRLVADVSAMVPVVLLDEIAAHLDADRRAALFDMIDDMRCQTFMTGTDADLFSSIKGEVQYMVIADGEIAS